MFTLTIKTDNAAFQDESARDGERDDGAARAQEVARILRHLASQVDCGAQDCAVVDANGNTVGRAAFK